MYTTTAMRIESALLRKEAAETHEALVNAEMEAKQLNITSQLLDRTLTMYDHVKRFGIDRTFVSLYNRHGELDRVCNIRFPSCESMDTVGDRYSYYSTRFLVAMEADSGGAWEQFKTWMKNIWEWITTQLGKLWGKISKLFGLNEKKTNKWMGILGGVAATAGVTLTGFLGAAVGNVTTFVKGHKAAAVAIYTASNDAKAAGKKAFEIVKLLENKQKPSPDDLKFVEKTANAALSRLKALNDDQQVKGIMGWLRTAKNTVVAAKQTISGIKTIWTNIKDAGRVWGGIKSTFESMSKGFNDKIQHLQGVDSKTMNVLKVAQDALNQVDSQIHKYLGGIQAAYAKSEVTPEGGAQQQNQQQGQQTQQQGAQAQPAQNGGNAQQQQ